MPEKKRRKPRASSMSKGPKTAASSVSQGPRFRKGGKQNPKYDK